MNDEKPLDMLQIKIDRAREELPKTTRKAIDSVDWRAVILSFREKKGYSFEQLEDLELETELLLCGLLDPKEYPNKLEEELKLPRAQIDLLVSEMNEFVFKKIKDELIRNTERESVFVRREEAEPITNEQLRITNEKETETIKPITNEQTKMNENKPAESISSQKLSGIFQIPTKTTEYTELKPTSARIDDKIRNSKDPYREIPE